MTQEEKSLLLKDLCARLPYKVIVHLDCMNGKILTREMGIGSLHDIIFDNAKGKPYLRPMSNMTKEERDELTYYDNAVQRTDFFYSHHIDCRFMIEKGLALRAPKGMYNIKRINYGNNSQRSISNKG